MIMLCTFINGLNVIIYFRKFIKPFMMFYIPIYIYIGRHYFFFHHNILLYKTDRVLIYNDYYYAYYFCVII